MAKVGDRVRITVEGVIKENSQSGRVSVLLDGGEAKTLFAPDEWAAAKVEVLGDPREVAVARVLHGTGLSENTVRFAARDILAALDASGDGK